jgi:arsenate reductase
MAEGWARHLAGDRIEPYSAGIEPKKLDAYAVKVMAEAGVDIAGHYSKHVNEMRDMTFDYVATVCDQAREQCPYFPAKLKVLHYSFDDPPKFAAGVKNEQKVLAIYRRVRDEIRMFVERLPAVLNGSEKV